MRQALRWVPAGLLFTVLAYSAPAGECENTVGALIGYRWIDVSDPDENADEPGSEVGIRTSWCGKAWPVFIAADVFRFNEGVVFYSPIPGNDYHFEFTAYELDLGAGYRWSGRRLQPSVSGGPALVSLYQEHRSYNISSDETVGWWVAAGLDYRFTGGFRLGLDARYTGLSDSDDQPFSLIDAAGPSIGLVLGYGW